MRIKIATDFSKTPGARYESEGDYPGIDFRENFLYPKLLEAIQKKEKLVIDLDGTAGLGTSFLEESFGGLIRVNKLELNTINEIIEFISIEDEDYIDEINDYLREAHEKESK